MYIKLEIKPGIAERYFHKLWLIMRLTTVILIAAIMQVSAAGFAQKISLTKTNRPLKEIIKDLRNQSGYDFVATDALLNTAKAVTIHVKDAELKKVLDEIFSNQPISYILEDNTVTLKAKEKPSFLDRILEEVRDIRVSGQVVDEKGKGMPGATIKLKGNKSTIPIVTSSDGKFGLTIPGEDAVLIVSYVGYKTKEVNVSGADVDLVIRLEPVSGHLDEVSVVSTGYQNIPRERSTGSFEKIDNEVFNRTTGTTVLARLEGIASGLIFDKRLTGNAQLKGLSIRGLNTLTDNLAYPLVILDNFPYDIRLLDNINPNDVENITILKDAAAASIWGARAGNGVIVITTKKGKYEQPFSVSINSNITIGEKPDLFSLQPMNSSDYIDVEKMLYGEGYYNGKINDVFTWPYLSPVVELLVRTRPGGDLTPVQANTQIDVLRQNDVRNDYLKYVYRNTVNQQYSLNINGGGKEYNYIISAGYDKNRLGVVKQNNDRITLRSDLSYKPLKHLEIKFATTYTQKVDKKLGSFSNLSYSPSMIPYLRLADENGNPVRLGVNHRMVFIDSPANNRYLDWSYQPLAELDASSNTTNTNHLLLNLGANYQISKLLSAEIKYQYGKALSDVKNWQGLGSYYTRDQINLLTAFNGADAVRPIPLGDIINQTNINNDTYSVRGQINAHKIWSNKHQIDAIAGLEKSENNSHSVSSNAYGFDGNTNTSQPVNYTTTYRDVFFGRRTIPGGSFSDQAYHFTSIYANAAYTYDNRYTLSASARKDASNLYGVKTNQKGTPLWSSGLSWNLANEPFYHLSYLPILKIRATYGYQGNTNNNLSAFSVIKYFTFTDFITGLTPATIQYPANSSLRWEKVGTLNVGLDFGIKNHRFSGSIDYYKKKSSDVLANIPMDLSTGFLSAVINAANLKGHGVDVQLHTENLKGEIKWNSDIIFSYNTNKVTNYNPVLALTARNVLNNGATITPLTGKPAYTIFSYKWAGLDPQTGEPMGYLHGQKSKDYAVLTNVEIGDLEYKGSAVPVYFGSCRNTFTWKNVSVSANILYRLGYYFRRSSIDYNLLFSSGIGNADYANRWKKPGDENTTNVPSLIYPSNPNRDLFYQYSSTLVSKGDNIRLQDIVISYNIIRKDWYLKNIKIYGNMSNVGMIWLANKQKLDPDYGTSYPAPRTISVGLNANF